MEMDLVCLFTVMLVIKFIRDCADQKKERVFFVRSSRKHNILISLGLFNGYGLITWPVLKKEQKRIACILWGLNLAGRKKSLLTR